jgi:hypothetical protein
MNLKTHQGYSCETSRKQSTTMSCTKVARVVPSQFPLSHKATVWVDEQEKHHAALQVTEPGVLDCPLHHHLIHLLGHPHGFSLERSQTED